MRGGVEVVVMSIERLQKAAAAAGFAMAAIDDDDTEEAAPAVQRAVSSPSLALFGVKTAHAPEARAVSVREAITPGSHWLKGFLPSLGGRAPA